VRTSRKSLKCCCFCYYYIGRNSIVPNKDLPSIVIGHSTVGWYSRRRKMERYTTIGPKYGMCILEERKWGQGMKIS